MLTAQSSTNLNTAYGKKMIQDCCSVFKNKWNFNKVFFLKKKHQWCLTLSWYENL